MKSRRPLGILGPELLEPRNAPASLLTYTDIDGDRVTVTASAGVLAGHATIVGGQLRLLDLRDPSFNGASIAFTVVKAGAGDGLAAVGRIDGGTNNLGAVTVKGDLGAISCGSNTADTPALKRLTVRSLGAYGLATQGGRGALESDINGALGALKVAGDLKGVLINVGGGANGTLGSVSIGGSLIGGSFLGPSGLLDGAILSSGDMGAVRIGHDVESGRIDSLGKLAGVSIGGSLIGGANGGSGAIVSTGDMGAVKIGGDLTGASIASGALDGSGFVESFAGRIAGVTIGGSIIAGTDNSAGGSLTNNATIRAARDIGAITVKGSLVGSVGSDGITNVIISAQGQTSPTATTDLAIGRIAVGGRVERAQILAGYDTGLSPVNGNAQVGAVSVGGDWAAGDLVAGVQDGGTAGFGDAGDTVIGGGASISRIASVTIKGVVVGTAAAGDQFGFVSHAVGRFKVNGVSIPVGGPVSPSPITADVTIRQV